MKEKIMDKVLMGTMTYPDMNEKAESKEVKKYRTIKNRLNY